MNDSINFIIFDAKMNVFRYPNLLSKVVPSPIVRQITSLKLHLENSSRDLPIPKL